jgi:hypothetical protein
MIEYQCNQEEVINMDYELIFWCIIGAFCLVVMLGAAIVPKDEPVSEKTIRRLCGERTH